MIFIFLSLSANILSEWHWLAIYCRIQYSSHSLRSANVLFVETCSFQQNFVC